MRESPALTLIDAVLAAGATVVAHDPAAMDEAKRRTRRPVIVRADELRRARPAPTRWSIVTDWNEYRHPDFVRMKEALRRPIVVDGRNLYDA